MCKYICLFLVFFSFAYAEDRDVIVFMDKYGNDKGSETVISFYVVPRELRYLVNIPEVALASHQYPTLDWCSFGWK